jgi:hypothetical protein
MLLAGCVHADVGINSGAPPAPPASVQVGASGAPALVLIGAVLLITTFQQTDDATPAAPMSPDRTINEQDCTKPVESGANLRCR